MTCDRCGSSLDFESGSAFQDKTTGDKACRDCAVELIVLTAFDRIEAP